MHIEFKSLVLGSIPTCVIVGKALFSWCTIAKNQRDEVTILHGVNKRCHIVTHTSYSSLHKHPWYLALQEVQGRANNLVFYKTINYNWASQGTFWGKTQSFLDFLCNARITHNSNSIFPPSSQLIFVEGFFRKILFSWT